MRIFKVCAIAAGMLCASQTTLAQTSLAFGYASEVSITGIEAKVVAGTTAKDLCKKISLSGFLPSTTFALFRGNVIVSPSDVLWAGTTYTVKVLSRLVKTEMPGEPPIVKVGDEVLPLGDYADVDNTWSWKYDFTVESVTVGEYRERYLAEHPDEKVCLVYSNTGDCKSDDEELTGLLTIVTWSSADKKFVSEQVLF